MTLKVGDLVYILEERNNVWAGIAEVKYIEEYPRGLYILFREGIGTGGFFLNDFRKLTPLENVLL
jgi:hypothetical protein